MDAEIIKTYICNLSKEAEGVPPQNIFNCDETNLSDDPGQKKVIIKRGMKYPERIINSALQTCISLMMCGSAAGELLPPFVVYKSSQLWSTWTEGGPPKCRYSNSPSGWFDAHTFTEWVETILISAAKKKQGNRLLICNNLSSHLTIHFMQKLEENNIKLICLPPNSTHLT